MLKDFTALWEQDNTYSFFVLDEKSNQIVGFAFLNHITRTHQLGNLAYLVKISRTGEGIATEAQKTCCSIWI